jgi:hypothetical protein
MMDDNQKVICSTELRMQSVRDYGTDELAKAIGDTQAERLALCRYLKRGLGMGFSTGELVDWFGVSTPSVLDEAGIRNNEDQQRMMDLLGRLSDEEIEAVRIGSDECKPKNAIHTDG